MTYRRLLHIFCLLIIATGVMVAYPTTQIVSAQDNLLRDPGFENPAFNVIADRSVSEGVLCTVPADWGGWITESPRNADWQNRVPNCTHQTDKAQSFVRSGNRSHEFSRGGATFTAAIYQTVSVPAVGTNVIGEAHYVMETVSGSTAQVRVGIDPNGGTNPFDSDIVWSSWGGYRKNTDGFGNLSVSATSTGTSVTLFIYVTQSTPTDPNKVFIDDASLVIGGAGGNAPGQSTAVPGVPPTATPIQNPVANFVSAQGEQPDGSIVHTVVEGDTLAAIGVAYRVPIDTIRELNPEIGRGSFLIIGQRLLIRPAPTPTPRGANPVSTPTPTSVGVAMAMTNTPRPTLTTVPSQGNTSGSGFFVTQTPRPSNVQATATSEPIASATPEVSAPDSATQAPVIEAPSATPTLTPEPSPIPTNTDLPPAPVVEPTVVAMNPQTSITGVCATFFNDVNRNRLADVGETPITGGIITLRRDGVDVSSYLTTGDTEPYCFTDLAPGNYVLVGIPPAGYGMTTPDQLQLRVDTGVKLDVPPFGASQGVEAPPVVVNPPVEPPAVVVEQPASTTPTQENNALLANLGIIILALAGVTLVTGIIGTILISRRG